MNNFNLFGIGPLELIFILIIALVVLGPERLPQVAREIAKLMVQIREIYTELMGTLTKEFGDMEELKEIQRDLNSLRDPLNLKKIGRPRTNKIGGKDASSSAKQSPAKPENTPATVSATVSATASVTTSTEVSQPLAPATNALPVVEKPNQNDAGAADAKRNDPPQPKPQTENEHPGIGDLATSESTAPGDER